MKTKEMESRRVSLFWQAVLTLYSMGNMLGYGIMLSAMRTFAYISMMNTIRQSEYPKKERIEDFVGEIRKAIGCRYIVPHDIYLIYDDYELYQKVLRLIDVQM